MGEVDLLLPLGCTRSTSGKAEKQGENKCTHTHGCPQSHFPHKKNRLCNGYDEPGCLCFYATADELFDESLQQELVTLYRASKRGHPPIPPAQLALAVILQAYTGVSDKECV